MLVDVPRVLPLRRDLLDQTRRSVPPQLPGPRPSCLETIQRLARNRGFSRRAAARFAHSRRDSSLGVYQAKWSVSWSCYRKEGFSSSRPSIPRLSDFLICLRESRGLSESALRGYRAMLGGVFRHLDIYPIMTYRLFSAQWRLSDLHGLYITFAGLGTSLPPKGSVPVLHGFH